MPGETLEQLEGDAWARPDFDSHLVQTCHRLRAKPLDAFTAEDLRVMIGQRLGLPHLVPLALNLLEDDPLAEGDCYPGDLLMSVVGAEPFVASLPGALQRLVAVVSRAFVRLGQDDYDLRRHLAEFLDRHRPREPAKP